MTWSAPKSKWHNDPEPDLPTYSAVAAVLEKKTGSGWALVGWTIARTALITPGLLLAGVEWQQALLGAAIASTLISTFTLVRIYSGKVVADLNHRRAITGRVRRLDGAGLRYLAPRRSR